MAAPVPRRAGDPPELAAAAASDPRIAGRLASDRPELWRNDQYVVLLRRRADGSVESLSIRRADRGAIRDWRHLQRIKNQLGGENTEAVELFPAEARLVDAANQTWLWCLPPGMRFPFGFTERLVLGPGQGPQTGAVQRPFDA